MDRTKADNVDLIFMCVKAKGFTIDSHYNITVPSGHRYEYPLLIVKKRLFKNTWENIFYPLLLSKAVDGINGTDPWKIDIYFEEGHGWSWSYKDYTVVGKFFKEADGAREAAIQYVMKLEVIKE